MTIYFVETSVVEQRVLLCRWTERFYMEKKRVQIVADSQAAAQYIDQLLWTFSQPSFIPHAIFNSAGPPPSDPVLITLAPGRATGFEAVVCDCPVEIEFMSRFDAAVHFILKDDPERTGQSRVQWLRARDLGLNPVHVREDRKG